jgi:hypothetical protein
LQGKMQPQTLSSQRYQVNAIENAMTRYGMSCAPCLFLPSSLQGEATSKRGTDHGTTKKTVPKTDTEQKPIEPWWTTNPSMMTSWSLPNGKTYNDFFNPREPEKKPNTQGWPKFPHHKFPSKTKNLCLKYQAKGACLSACFMAHVNPLKMETSAKQLVESQFKEIYKS